MAAPRPSGVVGMVAALLYGAAAAPTGAQSPCTYSIFVYDDSGVVRGSGSGGGYVRLDTQPGCAWTADGSQPWLRPARSGGVSDDGVELIEFVVDPNFTPVVRSAALRIADQAVTVRQARGVPTVDFNRDGFFDLLWHNRADGRLSTWLMNGAQVMAGPSFTPSQVPDTSWELAGGGDLDGDGHVDLVWQNTADGRVAAWLMAGLQSREGALLSIPQVSDLSWRIRAVSDVNGDGRADLLWQHLTNGRVSVWFMNGFRVLDGRLIGAPAIADLQWRLVGAASLDFDASLDLLWQHDGDGRLAVWYMSGTDLRSGEPAGSVADTNWKVRAVGDLDRDGFADLVWRHEADGRLSVWFGRLSSQTANLGTVADTTWHLVGPR